VQTPTARLLELLELLQARPLTTGREISDRLEIDARTVRRYVAALQDMGIPVEGQRGVGGGYRVRPGFRLPPLMLSGDEAVVVVLGLLAARRQGLESSEGSVEGALAKIHRVLPDLLRRRVEALETTLGFTSAERTGAPVDSEVALLVAEAIRRGHRLCFSYRAFTGEETARDVSPHGLVVHSGRWYLAAYDHGRADRRTFRVDRMARVAPAGGLWLSPPKGFDAVAHVSRSLANVPWRFEVVVLLELTIDEAADRIPGTVGELVEQDGGTLLRMRVGSLDWMAGVLARLGCGFAIYEPVELRERVHALASRLAASADRGEPITTTGGG
jgi:predicted DNA-binding transcriptional regulator YafY